MRILAAADIHGEMDVYKWLAATAPERHVELLILAGDLFSAGSQGDQHEQGREIVSILHVGNTPSFYIMGNDDEVHLEFEDGMIKSLHGKRLSVGQFQFVGYEYTPPFFGFTFVKSEEEIATDLLTGLKHVREALQPKVIQPKMCHGNDVTYRPAPWRV